MRDNCLIIAEAGVNHNGCLDLALQLCDSAKNTGADVVKFQTWKTEKIITNNVEQASYQVQNTGIKESQFDMLKRLELSYDDFRIIKQHCDEIGITFASTADEEESLDFLVSVGIPFIKIGSGDICNIPFLRYIGSKHLPVIMSTGMSTLEDVTISLEALRQGGATDITLLHCTTNYPCEYQNVNLKAMLTLQEKFRVPVGYSDHTMGRDASVAAVALGACVIEKHFTLDCNMNGPDHAASTEPTDFTKMVKSIRTVEMCLGNGIKIPTDKEQEISRVVKKRIVAKTDIRDGDVFSEYNICVKRNNTGINANYWDDLIGVTAKRSYKRDQAIEI